jgi:hypothetical protein
LISWSPKICRLVSLSAASLTLVASWHAHGQWTRHTIEAGSTARDGADGARLGDLNDDGLLDVIVSLEESGLIRAYVNPGPDHVTGTWAAVTVGAAPDVEDSFFVDLDGDGRLDVISSEETGNAANPQGNVRVHFAPTSGDLADPGHWSQHEPITAAADRTQWMFGQPLQVDGQRGPDLIVGGKHNTGASGTPQSTLGWLAAPVDPRADPGGWTYHEIDRVGWTMSILTSDIDGDGDQDVVVSDRFGDDRGVRWLENPSLAPDGVAITDPWTPHAIGAVGREVGLIGMGDLDADGDQDVVVPTIDGSLTWYQRSGPGGTDWVAHAITYPAGVGDGKAAAVADVNGDGQSDIVLTTGNADGLTGVVWLEHGGDPTAGQWLIHDISGPDGSKFDLAQMVDLDGDGDLDLITTDEGQGAGDFGLGVVWYENPTVPEPAAAAWLVGPGVWIASHRPRGASIAPGR